MPSLLETLAAELERPRELSARVLNYICGTYSIDEQAIGAFFVEELPKLEDYEIDLILSPVFTPKLADQALFAEFLGGEPVPRDQWPGLIQQLAARPTRAQLITADSRAHSLPLREVTLERFVHRLRLEGSILRSVLDLIGRVLPASDRPLLKAIARRAVWENTRGEILERYLANAIGCAAYSLEDALALLDTVESYKPAYVAGLLAWIPPRQDVLRTQINTGAGGKPFFSPRIQEMHGGDRDQRRQEEEGKSAKELELAFLDRVQRTLGPTPC